MLITEAQQSGAYVTQTNTPNPRFLMVEDNPDNAEFTTWLLEDENYDVDCAETAEIGLKMLSENNYALVLMDISLPGMDGRTAIEVIRNGEGQSDIPIIAVTAHAILEEREEILQSGSDFVITKPIDEDALLNVISQCLEGNIPRRR